MKYIKTFDGYKYVDNTHTYYNIPFKLYDDEVCITGADNWVLCFNGNNFVYDYITDVDIKNALELDLSNVDISKDWTNFNNGFENAYVSKEKHTLRIAKLVQEIKNGSNLNPISMCFDDTAYIHDIKNYIEDGNHRIRALQYLKYKEFPAYIYGNYAKYLIDYLDYSSNSN